MGKYLALFTIVPIVETFLLYTLGQALGFWATTAIVLITGVVGAALAKREGLKVWRSWTAALAEMRMPEEGILGGLMVLVGGVLLVTPGVLTDVTGMALLVPPSRRFLAKQIRPFIERKIAGGGTTTRFRVDLGGGRVVERVERTRGSRRGGADVIDVEGEVVEEHRVVEGVVQERTRELR